MWVTLKEEVFADLTIDQLELLTLFNLGFKGQHRLEIEYDNSNSFAAWLEKLPHNIQEECNLALKLAIEEEALRPCSVRHEVNAQNFQSSMSILNNKFKIVLENRRNDKNFLLTVALAERKKELKKLIDKEFIEFEGGGLGEIKNYLDDLKNDLIDRIWVLFDSDAVVPNKPSKQSEEVRKKCESLNVAYHQLKRRTIENYLPIPLLKSNKTHQDKKTDEKRKIRALDRLTLEQRSHFSMKSGFSKDENHPDKADIEQLYANFLQNDPYKVMETLDSGFGDDVAKLFNDKTIHYADSWFIDDEQCNEINPMLDKLFSLI